MADILAQIYNFDALGLMTPQEVRDEIADSVPAWHYQGLNLISYSPDKFLGYSLRQSVRALGLYLKATKIIYVNTPDLTEIKSALEELQAMFAPDEDVLARLGTKRDRVRITDQSFSLARDMFLEVLFHELGHHVYAIKAMADSRFVRTWEELFETASSFVTSCAETDAEENFSECYMCYVSNRSRLRQGHVRELKTLEPLFLS